MISKKLSLEFYNKHFIGIASVYFFVPQFNFSTYSSQIFWLLLCFGVFFSYIKFYFLPKLEGILKTRNEEISNAEESVLKNNSLAEENLAEVQKIVRTTNTLTEKIIADAEAKAKKQENEALAKVQGSQKQAISEILESQKTELSEEVLKKAVLECSKTVLQNIGFNVKNEDIEGLIK